MSRVTKFVIERGATVDVDLTSDQYQRTPLVQGGLEINATRRQVTEHYSALVKELSVEPKEEEILGSLTLVNDIETMDEDSSIHQRNTRPMKQPGKPNESTTKSKDIRTFSNKERNVVAHAIVPEKKSL